MLYWLSDADRATVMNNLFDPATGAGISFLRQPIGASDFVADKDYSFDDVPAGQTDYSLSHFSIAHDEAKILPFAAAGEETQPGDPDRRQPVEPRRRG
ncbi:hypothetical protein [Fodinicola feengrottensis]|uniref:hypothetical protein n=1 Tax=Fodinicola feengrottensis TaxID=435914 RepID=UPI002442CEEF|nr:hypothetical protein [Fodinicola feengrottensis]